MELKFGDYEIRPSDFLVIKEKSFGTKQVPGRYDLLKWYNHEPTEVTDIKTGIKKTKTRSCFVIATFEWIEGKDPYFKFSSCGNRFLEACIDNAKSSHPIEWDKLCDWIIGVEKILTYAMRTVES